MTHELTCPSCSAAFSVDPRDCGDSVVCPDCGEGMPVPTIRVALDDADLSAGVALPAGTRLSGFAIIRQLGSGGMGTVYLARQESMDRQVALKVLPPALAHETGNIERFQQEVRLQARLDHQNIVPAFEAGYADGRYYLAMAYVEGQSLHQRLALESRLGAPLALRYMEQVADALDYAWRDQQLLHRDLKPSNIMVDRHDKIRLLDLGIAKCINDNATLTHSNVICGTPHYMSPEQALGRRDLDCRSDIYAFGATLYHLVTGSTPFRGQTSLEVLHQHAFEPLEEAHMRNPEVARKVSRFISALMAKDRDDRPANWGEVLHLLERLQGLDTELKLPVKSLHLPYSTPKTKPVSGEQPAGAAAPTDKTTTFLDRFTLMLKGVVVGCLAWGLLLAGVFLIASWGCVSCLSNGCNVSESEPDVHESSLDDLAPHIGNRYAVDDGWLKLGPADSGVVWLSKHKPSYQTMALRLRLISGDSAGLLLWPETHSADPSTLATTIEDDEVRLAVVRTADGQEELRVTRRVRGEQHTLATLDRGPSADGWYRLQLDYGGGSDILITWPDGSQRRVDGCFTRLGQTDSFPACRWGLFAEVGSEAEFEMLNALPTDPGISRRQPSGTDSDAADTTP